MIMNPYSWYDSHFFFERLPKNRNNRTYKNNHKRGEEVRRGEGYSEGEKSGRAKVSARMTQRKRNK